jgi:hypothetical protein
MTKIQELMKDIQKVRFGGVKEKLRNFLISKKDEVFNRSELRETFPNFALHTIDVYLQDLVKRKEIDKIKFGRITYYGNKKAIEQLKKASIGKKVALPNLSKMGRYEGKGKKGKIERK